MRPLAIAFVLGLVACSSSNQEPANQEPTTPPAKLVDLSASLEPLRAEFNAHKGEARFLTLLSPT